MCIFLEFKNKFPKLVKYNPVKLPEQFLQLFGRTLDTLLYIFSIKQKGPDVLCTTETERG